jgi:hypothetical protein
MPSQPTADPETMRFRAPTLEEAIATAERSLGARVIVTEANRIRRGGIGGFFAADMGVEVVVSLADESMDEALERLVTESEADERSTWQERRSRDRAITRSIPAVVPDAEPAPEGVDSPALAPFAEEARRDALRRELARRLAIPHDASPADATDAIVGELRSLAGDETSSYRRVQEAAERLAADPFLHGQSPRDEDDAPSESAAPDAASRRPTRRLGSPSAATTASSRLGTPSAMAPADLMPTRPSVRFAQTERTPVEHTPIEHKPAAIEAILAEVLTERLPSERAIVERLKIERLLAEHPMPAAERIAEPAVELVAAEPVVMSTQTAVETIAATAADVLTAPRQRNSGPPSRRHVELAVAAADQLIDSLSRSGSVQRLSVRVVLRSGDQREVEAEAQWEARPELIREVAS